MIGRDARDSFDVRIIQFEHLPVAVDALRDVVETLTVRRCGEG